MELFGATHRRQKVAVVVAVVGVLAAFVVHAAAFGAWIIDDAGISMAYARNLAHGNGLVAQPGATPVEGFSNPLWVFVLATLSLIGLFGRGDLFAVPDYVMVTKGSAIVLHLAVIVCLGVLITRIVSVAVTERAVAFNVSTACWAAAGMLLAANPSYVIWMVSGLENPLLAAEVAAIAAVSVHAVPNPGRRSTIVLGLLTGLAAITRPDGVVYASAIFIVVLFAVGLSWRARWSVLWPGLVAFGSIFLGYLMFRLAYFGAWLPNTAVAKSQDVPALRDILRLKEVGGAFGWPLSVVSLFGAALGGHALQRAGNTIGLRVIAAGAAVLLSAVAAFIVLREDWMVELRFLTPAWPLLSVAAVLGLAQLATMISRRRTYLAAATILVVCTALTLPAWQRRSQAFRADPIVPLCFVAERSGQYFNIAAGGLGLDPRTTTVLLPDLGGTLMVSDLVVVDLAGLTNRRIAELLRDGDPAKLAGYILGDLKPTFIHLLGYWRQASGLAGDSRFASDYLDLIPGIDYVRRDSLSDMSEVGAVSEVLRQSIALAATHRRESPRGLCGDLLLG